MHLTFDNAKDFYRVAEGRQLQIDSRSITPQNADESIFIALSGKHTDGHQFLADVHAKGVRFFIVRWVPEGLDGHFFVADNPLIALQELCALHRQRFHYPVVGITGSNGKTILKEWLAELLAEKFNIIKSPKSYNSQLGVPLSVWQMSDRHNLAIFEAGISTRDSMKPLAQVIRPTIGIFTNIGTAHDEGFSSRSEKIREKLQLFNQSEVIIFNSAQQELRDEILNWHFSHPNCQLISWGTNENDVVKIKIIEKNTRKTVLDIYFNASPKRLQLPFADSASLENALHCIIAMWHLTKDADYIDKSLSKILNSHMQPAMRLVRKKGINRCTLIDDSYNNDLAGLRVALEFLALHAVPNRPRTLILSDMLQSGLSHEAICREVEALIGRFDVSRLLLVGQEWANLQVPPDLFVQNFADTASLLAAIDRAELTFIEENILIKGARSFGFEQIVARLEEKIHGTRLEINLDAVGHNLGYYKSLLKPGVKIMAMVKAFAYGSGSHEIAQYLQQKGCDYLAVAYADEGITLRQQGVSLPVMVMNPSADSFALLHSYRLEPEIYGFRILQEWLRFNAAAESSPPIHLKIDTGMHRLGFLPNEIGRLCEIIRQHKDILSISGIFTHLAGADEERLATFSQQQLHLFESAAAQVEHAYGKTMLKYALNSAGIVRFPDAQYDMVRLGIGLYGIEANGIQQSHLQAVATLKTTISQIKNLQPGDTVGYGRHGQITRPSRIATLAIGYADGYRRMLGNGKGHFWIHGKQAPTVGRICMDMCMADITHIPEAQEGDEALVFYDAETLQQLANQLDTIPYEVLTGIGERVKRIYFSA
ncbi:bifunctional UDP-N-acetylmuramoyl-tripeptide:D-alanyl-D-alanine ligase/alanine racemase [Rhodoflexus caldus]|uniref:bifunctional UDP-N-acetylmuramoyl-tripeptide:D-alanyl-D-alanine ligase/alanine racemase n=1 Tax=Rhodoflexus caldus TaxID=2891236 RepID=UPI00202A4350|nr:bifunctional UDP-N-acetylmuramoyl-tripeptide:D-alanyl-D-alanine ligase/alanine racemase [Rhodoflexus caldus]